jgi:hypothetical protein
MVQVRFAHTKEERAAHLHPGVPLQNHSINVHPMSNRIPHLHPSSHAHSHYPIPYGIPFGQMPPSAHNPYSGLYPSAYGRPASAADFSQLPPQFSQYTSLVHAGAHDSSLQQAHYPFIPQPHQIPHGHALMASHQHPHHSVHSLSQSQHQQQNPRSHVPAHSQASSVINHNQTLTLAPAHSHMTQMTAALPLQYVTPIPSASHPARSSVPVTQASNQSTNSPRGPEGASLFVYNIPESYQENDLSTLFASFGTVMSARIQRDKNTGQSKGYGFVSFDDPAAAATALQSLDGYTLGNKRLSVQPRHSQGKGADRKSSSSPSPNGVNTTSNGTNSRQSTQN